MGWIVRARRRGTDELRHLDGSPVTKPFRAVGGVWTDVPADEDTGRRGFSAGSIRYVPDEEAVVLATREDAVRFAAVLWCAHELDDMFGTRSEVDWCEIQPGQHEPEFEYVEV